MKEGCDGWKLMFTAWSFVSYKFSTGYIVTCFEQRNKWIFLLPQDGTGL